MNRHSGKNGTVRELLQMHIIASGSDDRQLIDTHSHFWGCLMLFNVAVIALPPFNFWKATP